MKSFFKTIISRTIAYILAFFVIILLSIGVISIASSRINSKEKITLKENSILTINLSELTVVERNSNNPLEDFHLTGDIEKKIELKQILDNIEKAKTDEYIQCIYINSPFINAGLSQIEEIRNKLLDFKKTGKKIISYAEVYTQLGYYLASVSDKIYLTPEGGVELKGFSASPMFYKGLLEKLDIDVQIIRHGKFKSAGEPFMLEKMSKENRSQIKLLVNSIATNIFDSIANQRGLSLERIEKDANQLNLNSSKDCIDLGYIDGLLYQDQINDSLIQIIKTEKLNFIDINKYSNIKHDSKPISRNKIAVIYATGNIKSGKGDETNIGSKTTSLAIKKAREDKYVKAIVLRINSGGGSALASDIIWRETLLAKAKKPFIVSMGDVAASGGYYIACAADTIVANPTTITGSIGVFGMIPNVQKFYKNKLGITVDTVNTHKYADLGINRPLYEYEKQKIQNSIRDVYETFITKVAQGRQMNKDIIDEIGQGRVWTGYDAKKIGLIDIYGGLETAVNIAAELSKSEDYRIISLPEKKDPLSELLSEFNNIYFPKLLQDRIGLTTEVSNSMKDILEWEKIQARMPYYLELK